MAIPDNYIDKITKGNDSRMISPAADMVRVNNDNFEGETLDDVLDEVAQDINEAGEVKSVTINGTNHTPDSSGVVDLGTIQGEKGEKGDTGSVTVTDGVAQITIVNDLTTGGTGDALSAEMGKVLKIAVSTLIDSIGEYCFPNGRPTLSFEGPKCDVTQNLTDVTSDFSALRVDEGVALEIKLTLPDNYHVFLTGDVTVEMPLGNDITSTAWNESTGKVTIASVTDDVVITAKSSAYVQSDLAFMLDCKNRGGQSGHWIDLVGNIDFALTNVIESDNGMVFNGSSSKGVAESGSIVAPYDSCTVEVIATAQVPASTSFRVPILMNPNGGNAAAALGRSSSATGSKVYFSCCSYPYSDVSSPKNTAFYFGDSNNIAIASTKDFVLINGIVQADPRHTEHNGVHVDINDYSTGTSDLLSIGYRKYSSGSPTEYFLNGSIKAVRIYTRKLSVSEMQKNYELDKKRFNLS
jgi:hypothetical protein